MRTFLLRVPSILIATALLTSCGPGSVSNSGWTTARPEAAGFELKIPSGYSSWSGEGEHAYGIHKLYTIYWRNPELDISKLGLKLISAGYFDISELSTPRNAPQILDSFMKHELRISGTQQRSRVISMNDDSVSGYPARCLRYIADKGKTDSLYLIEQFVMRGDKIYQLRLNGYTSASDTASIEQLRRSFRLLPEA